MNAIKLQANLDQFCGTEQWHRYSCLFKKVVLTDGVKYLADNAGGGAYWLMDAIASYQGKCRKDPSLCDIQFWTLTVHENKRATLICERDSGDVAFTQEIDHTDFPLPSIKLWVECSGDNMVILLPNEH